MLTMIEAQVETMAEPASRPAGRAAAPPLVRYVSNADESCRMFVSDARERFSHVKPWVPHVIYVPVALVSLAVAFRTTAPMRVAAFYVVGLFLWTLFEYLIHRGLFHTTQFIQDDTRRIVGSLRRDQPVLPNLPTLRHKFYFVVHGVHHDFPNDSTRLVMPPSMSIPLAVIFYAAFSAVPGVPAPAMFAGYISGYLVYDTMHYASHHSTGRSALLRSLRRRHFRHHYADPTRDFGVSSPLWDYIIGTRGSAETARSR
jgi:4-hydroxysphinganine ceramide fatty acyl 2-hydroxylase